MDRVGDHDRMARSSARDLRAVEVFVE